MLRLPFGKQPLMTQACSVPYSSRPPPCYFFFLPGCFSFLFLFIFLLLKYLAVLLTVRFPPHIGSAGLFCPQNAAEICSSPNQMAAFTERSVTPVPHHMTFASLGAVSAKGPPVLAKTRAPLQGGSTPMASQVPKENWFLYLATQTLVSSECFKNADLVERTWCLLGEVLKKLAGAEQGLVPGANLFTVKFSRTCYMRMCDWTEAYIHTNGQKGLRRGCPDCAQLLIEV